MLMKLGSSFLKMTLHLAFQRNQAVVATTDLAKLDNKLCSSVIQLPAEKPLGKETLLPIKQLIEFQTNLSLRHRYKICFAVSN